MIQRIEFPGGPWGDLKILQVKFCWYKRNLWHSTLHPPSLPTITAMAVVDKRCTFRLRFILSHFKHALVCFIFFAQYLVQRYRSLLDLPSEAVQKQMELMPPGCCQPGGESAVDEYYSLLPLGQQLWKAFCIFLKDPCVMEPPLPNNHLDNTPAIATSSFPVPLASLFYFCFLESSPNFCTQIVSSG